MHTRKQSFPLLFAVTVALAYGLLGGAVIRAARPATSSTVALQPGDSVVVSCAGPFTVVPAAGVLTIGCTAQGVGPTTTATVRPTTTTTPPPGATPTATALPTVAPPSGPTVGIWLSQAEVKALPMTGAGWNAVKAAADGAWGAPNLSDLNAKHDVYTLAGALVYARTGQGAYRSKAAAAIAAAMGTESSSRALEVSRNIQSYVFAADLIDLKTFDSGADTRFRAWLAALKTRSFDGMSIVESSEKRPNNWGTHAMAARIAIDRYLGDSADLGRAALVFRGWLGDRSAYAGFDYGDTSWQADPGKPVGINPAGATKSGHSIDGVLPDDQRRAGGYTWPPPCENYVHEALQGALVAATELKRAGYDAWSWQGQALRRSYAWLYTVDSCPAAGDDGGFPFLVNAAYGTTYAGARPAPVGKNVGWLDWTHGSR